MAQHQFDVVVVGGGPGGYVAAIRASQLGLKTALVEREHLGGICLNWGCIPTKALLRSAEVYHNIQHAADYGLSVKGVDFDLQKIVSRSRDVSGKLVGGIKGLMKKNKVTVFDGLGKITGKNALGVYNKEGVKFEDITAKHIILATGARARSLPGLEADGKLVWTYKEALVPNAMPKKLLVVGSGAIGSEFASFFLTLGAEVTLVEVQDRVLPVEDAEISTFVAKQFTAQGMTIKTSTVVKALERGKDSVKATLVDKDGKESKETFDRVIMAVGIVGNSENIGLEHTRVKTERGHIKINEYCETDEPGVYAIGDVVGAPWLAHKASHEGVICVEKIAGLKPHPLKVKNIPGCTYTRPQVASVGYTEQAAKDAGYTVKVGRFPFFGNGKAIALGEPDGLVKTVFDAKTGELLGAHMVGAEVTEMIQGYGLVRTMEGTEQDIMHAVFPHPTLSEMMHESALDAYGRALHI
jgi:dihydrolipoamide dehydrogenase